MKWVSFRFNGVPRVGVMEGYRVYDAQTAYALYLKEVEGDLQASEIAKVLVPNDMLRILKIGIRSVEAARKGIAYVLTKPIELVGVNGEWVSYSLNDVKLEKPLKPIAYVVGTGLDTEELFYLKSPQTLVGPQQPILINTNNSERYSVQLQLGVVLSKGGRFIPEQQVMEHIFGYTIVHNVVNQEPKKGVRNPRRWLDRYLGSHVFDRSSSIGTWIVDSDYLEDLNRLVLNRYRNDDLLESQNIKHLSHRIEKWISNLSQQFTLEAGMLIAVGLPSGIVNPFLKTGDSVIGEIEGIGYLVNTVLDEGGLS